MIQKTLLSLVAALMLLPSGLCRAEEKSDAPAAEESTAPKPAKNGMKYGIDLSVENGFGGGAAASTTPNLQWGYALEAAYRIHPVIDVGLRYQGGVFFSTSAGVAGIFDDIEVSSRFYLVEGLFAAANAGLSILTQNNFGWGIAAGASVGYDHK
ncbi:MAG: hypothetical protein ACXVBW_12155, partial [Bdellovibrionota bacterium]